MFIVRLKEIDERGVLVPDLFGILKCLEGNVAELDWTILAIEGRGDLTSLGVTIIDLEHQAASVEGVSISWEMLVAVAQRLEQVNDCLIVAGRKGPAPRNDSLKELLSLNDVVIEAVDSTYWVVGAHDLRIRYALESCFTSHNMLQD